MMANFDPDAYLGSAPSGGGGFDPDAYLGTKPTTAREDIAKQHEAAGQAMAARAAAPPEGLGEKFNRNIREAGKKISGAVESLTGETEAYGPLQPGQTFLPVPTPEMKAPEQTSANPNKAGFTPYDPFGLRTKPGEARQGLDKTVSALGEIAGGAMSIAAPVKAPYEKAIGEPVEKATGIPMETQEALLLGLGPIAGGLVGRGAGALTETSSRGRDVYRRPQQGPQEPTATPRPDLDPNAKVMPPSVPHSYRPEAGAARASGILEGMSPEARQLAVDKIRQTGLNEHTAEAAVDEASPHETFAEVAGLHDDASGLQTHPGQHANEQADTYNGRHTERGERISGLLDDTFGNEVNTAQWEDAVRGGRARESKQFWDTFRDTQIAPTPQLEALMPALEQTGAVGGANSRLVTEKALLRAQGATPEQLANVTGFNEEGRIPSAQAYQFAKEHLDGMIRSAVRGEYKEGSARQLTALKSALTDAIDNHPDPNVSGRWKAARDTWAQPSSLISAKQLGEEILTNNVDREDLPGVWRGLSPPERQAAFYGIRKHLADALGGMRNRADTTVINKLLSRNNMEKIGAIVDDTRAQNLFEGLRAEERMAQSRSDIVGNSRTAVRTGNREQWTTDALNPGVTGRVAQGAEFVGGLATKPVRTLGKAAAKMGLDFVERQRQAKAQGLREEIGRLYNTQGPERDAALHQLAREAREGEGGLAGPVGRQPLAPRVLERGRSGRPIKRTALPIGNEDKILERAEQRLGEGPRVVGSQKEMDDVLRKNWAEHGPSRDPLDDAYEDLLGAWNKEHPERQLDAETLNIRGERDPEDLTPAGQMGRSLVTARDDKGPVPNFDDFYRKFDLALGMKGDRQRYPGAKEANQYFASDPETHKHTAFTSLRQMRNTSEDLVPPTQQAMAFSSEPTRRRFLQGMASTLAAANPELGKIAAGLTRGTAALPRLEDAGYGRSLARQAAYMFGDDKRKAADYLLDQLKHSRPGSVVEKANRDALRHITSGDIDKEPGIWAKSIAEMRKHDDTVRAGQTARRAAEEGLRGRGELPGGEGKLEAHGGADQEAGRAAPEAEREPEPPLEGLPRKVSVPGVGKLNVGPHEPARDVARQYMADAGLPYNPPKDYAKVDPARAARIADEYAKMPHAPDDPAVKAAYDAMAQETMAQWQAIRKSGLKVEFIPPDAPNPYAASPRLVAEDVKNNNHMWVYSTRDGFGTGEAFDPRTNPLLADSGEKISGQPALLNDIFRAVHDYFGHIKEGVGFRADGEENAWRSHAAMYSPLARKAMTSETRGQNSWLNYGPHGETNRTAKTENTVYADQKTGVLPDWVVNEGSGQPERVKSAASRFRGKVYEGPAHMMIDDTVPEQIGVDPFDFMRDREEGFTTSEGRFVSRDEAKKIAGAPGDMRFESSQLRQPLQRNVTERGRSGRPTKTTPLETGREADVLRSGYEKATGEHPDRISQRAAGTRENAPSTAKVDVATLKEEPEAFKTNTDLLRPMLPNKLRSASPDKVASAFVDHVADNLKWLYDQVPQAIRDRSKLWYDGGNAIAQHWAKEYGIKDSAAAAVMAVLSPQKDWFQNVSLAGRVLEINRNLRDVPFSPQMAEAFEARPTLHRYRHMLDDIRGKSLEDIDKIDMPEKAKYFLKALWTRLYDEAHHDPAVHVIDPEGTATRGTRTGGKGAEVDWSPLNQIGRAIEAIDANGDAAINSRLAGDGNKVRNFFNNLLNPNSRNGDVTIDTHAVAAGLLRPLGGTAPEVMHNFGSWPGPDLPTSANPRGLNGTYPFYADAYRKVAKDLGLLPRELQSITWEAVRGMFESAGKKSLRPAVESIWKQYNSGRISADDARQQILKLTDGIKSPEWAGGGRGGGRTEALQDTSNPEELPRSRVSREPAKAARGGGGGEFTKKAAAPEFARGGAVSAPLSARKKYDYHPDRGTNAEHCGNCLMFRKPHSCTAVGGFIAPFGKCDIWEAARKKRADGGSLFDPTPMADNPPYSLSRDFHERLPEAEGQVEDRRGEDHPWDRMMSNLRNVRRATGNMEIGFDYRLPRATGKLAKDLGVHDIERPRRDIGGAIPGFPALAGGPGGGIAPMPEWGWNSQQPMAQPKSPTVESGFSFGGNHALTAESMEPSASSTTFKSGFSMLPSGGKGK